MLQWVSPKPIQPATKAMHNLKPVSILAKYPRENEQRRCKQETEMKMGIKLFLGLKYQDNNISF